MKTNLTTFLFFILLSTTGFAQQYGWVDISHNLPNSPGTVTLTDMHWISQNEGWICSGFTGEIFHTSDGGQTFTIQTTQFNTNAIYMFNSLEGYSGGAEGRVYKTSNGGTTWVVHGSIGGPLLDIDFPPNSKTGYCCGDQGKIYKITSTGISSMSSGVTAHLRSISFPSSDLGWTCSNGIIRHFDGVTWYEQDSPLSSYNGIYMINNTTGWAVGDFGVIVNTTDGGLSWKYQANPDASNRNLNDVYFLNASEGWAVGFNGIILHTTNGGKLWTIEGAGLTTNMLRSVQFTSSTNGYVLGNKGTLLKFGILTDVEEPPAQSTGFTLEQNYPNPFNKTTTITWQQPEKTHVVLKVCDFKGSELKTLVDGEQERGEHNVKFDAAGLPSGIYVYKFQANGYIKSKKMFFLK